MFDLFLTNVPQETFQSASTPLGLSESFVILFLALLTGLYLRYIYTKFSLSYSSKISFANTLLIVTLSVASIIAVVKSSLALSLGLVGALSVIRFRTAVKEPFNLGFLLLSICLGISVGASQYLFAFMVIFFGTLAIYLSYRSNKQEVKLSLTSKLDDIDTISIKLKTNYSSETLFTILKQNTSYYSIISLEEIPSEFSNFIINIKLKDDKSLSNLREAFSSNFPNSIFNFYNTPIN
tara:strand:- start:7758 stop:8468 length:711 start_codon:yes stop_codon:yes gene_type:complete